MFFNSENPYVYRLWSYSTLVGNPDSKWLASFRSDELREHLKNAPKMIMAQQRAGASDSDSDSSNDSSSEGLWENFDKIN